MNILTFSVGIHIIVEYFIRFGYSIYSILKIFIIYKEQKIPTMFQQFQKKVSAKKQGFLQMAQNFGNTMSILQVFSKQYIKYKIDLIVLFGYLFHDT